MIIFGVPQFTVSYAVVYWAEQHISSGMTSVLFAAFPFWVAGFSAWLLKSETWTSRKFVGLVCGILGVGTVLMNPAPAAHAAGAEVASNGSEAVLAVWALLATTAICGISITWVKRLYHDQDTFALTSMQLLGGALGLSVVALILEDPLSVRWTVQSALATVYLAVFGSVLAFLGYYWLLKRIEGTMVATVTFVTPILALLLGWLVRGETITWWLLVGSLLVLIGLRSVAISGRKVPAAARLEAVECELT
jgi:drug/metabolite transporter (DMT)-like permease